MKKIVGILAVAALFASTVFAADISAKVELDGKLFNYDGGMSALNIDKPAAQHWNAVFSTSVNGDGAGAEFVVMSGENVSDQMNRKFGWWNDGKVLAAKNWKIWMKPADAVKFTIGANGVNLNQEQITWSGTTLKSEGDGFGVNFGVDALSIDLLFIPGLGADWLSKPENGDVAVGTTGFKLGYNADFGNIGFLFQGESTFKKNTIAAGYSNTFGGVFAFLNAGAVIADASVNQGKNNYTDVRAEVFAKGNADAFGWAVWVPFDFYTDDTWKDDNGAIKVDQKKGAHVGAIIHLTYALDGATAYFRFNDANFLADSFAAEFRLGAQGNVGGAGWNIWAQIDVADKTKFSIPCEFSYAF